jgi:hypothetical protein
MTRQEAHNTLFLYAWLVAWEKAYADYRDWRTAEWRARRQRFSRQEIAARRALVALLDTLEYDADGRVRKDTGKARRAIKAFRKSRDKVLTRLVQAGRGIFDIQAKVDPDSMIVTGRIAPDFRIRIEERLKAMIEQVRAGIEVDPEELLK